MLNGILNINKPDGLTSSQVVSIIKKITKCNKVGHLGTLDPLGSGVLPITLDKATRLFDYSLKKIKTYRAIFYFGKETDTLDSEGKVTNTLDKIPTKEDIEAKLQLFIGKISQLPPKYCANSINGKKAYELARENKEVNLQTKEIVVFSFQLLNQIDTHCFLFQIECGAGCYIRSLCRDLAYELNTFAYMPCIIRIKAGIFEIKDSVTIKELENAKDWKQYLISPEKVIDFLPLILSKENSIDLLNGKIVKVDYEDGLYKLYREDTFFAIGSVSNKKVKMEAYLE